MEYRRTMSTSSLTGDKVYNTMNEDLGKIEDLMIDVESGRVAYAVLSFGGFLGMGDSYHPLPWGSLTYDTSREGYVVDLTREQLEGAPSYLRDEEPDWNDPVYGQRLTGYYGLPYI